MAVMAAKRTSVALDHPTVVPDSADDEHEHHVVRCPACGRPLADHE
jgi:hypothetical protein